MSSDTWKFTTSLADINLHGGRSPTEECFVQVKVFQTEHRVTRAGDDRCIFYTRVTTGPHEGCVITDGLNFPIPATEETSARTGKSMDELAKLYKSSNRFLGKMLVSCGFSEKAIRKPTLTISNKTFMGREGYLHFVPAPEGGRYSEVNWLSKERYLELTNQTPAPVSSQPAPVPEAAPVVANVAPVEVDAAPPQEEAVSIPTSESEDPLDFMLNL
jgi:hypothetical protein